LGSRLRVAERARPKKPAGLGERAVRSTPPVRRQSQLICGLRREIRASPFRSHRPPLGRARFRREPGEIAEAQAQARGGRTATQPATRSAPVVAAVPAPPTKETSRLSPSFNEAGPITLRKRSFSPPCRSFRARSDAEFLVPEQDIEIIRAALADVAPAAADYVVREVFVMVCQLAF